MAATPLAVASGCRQQPTDRSVRLGSFSDLGARSCEVRFTLKTRHRQPSLSGPKSAKTGSAPPCSITSAMASGVGNIAKPSGFCGNSDAGTSQHGSRST